MSADRSVELSPTAAAVVADALTQYRHVAADWPPELEHVVGLAFLASTGRTRVAVNSGQQSPRAPELPEDGLVAVTTAARYLGVTERTLRRYRATGVLAQRRIGGRVFVLREQLVRLKQEGMER